jgi:hypothetical protein
MTPPQQLVHSPLQHSLWQQQQQAAVAAVAWQQWASMALLLLLLRMGMVFVGTAALQMC